MKIDFEEIVQTLKDDRLTFSLLLTRRCNFRCDHCFYESGPHRNGTWISDDVLFELGNRVRELKELEIYPSINLVGGEPTLNMDHFERVVDHVTRWDDTSIEMTTNGWWLANPAATRRFFEIVTPYVDYDGEGSMGFSVRISHDQYHDPFRPNWLQGEHRLKSRLENLWEFDEDGIFYNTYYECGSCDVRYDRYYDDECPKCGDYMDITDELAIDRIPPKPAEGDPWIYVEGYSKGREFIIPVGRGGSWVGGFNDKGKRYAGKVCQSGITFDPFGNVTDICCSGSNVPVGTVWDHPILLVALAERFLEDKKPSCWGCHEDSRDWIRNGFKSKRAEYERELERFLDEREE